MALDFPTSPTVGQQYGGYIFDGVKWKASPTSVAPSVVSATPPTNPTVGDMWFNSTDGTMYFYYNDGNTSQWVESRAPITANGYYSPNYVINGAFDIWQRGTSGFTSGYTADRWFCNGANSVSRSTDTPSADFAYSISASNTSATVMGLTYRMESSDSARLAGKTATFSFWFKRVGAIANLQVNIDYPPSADTWSGATNIVAQVVSTSPSTGWTKYSFSLAMPSVASRGIQISVFGISTSGNISQSYLMTGVQLEEGSTATPFRRNANSIQGELAACQRYYQRFTSLGAYTPMAGSGFVTGSTNTRMHFVPAVPGRIAPTSMTVSNFGIYDTFQVFNVGSYALVTPTTTFFAADFTISGGTQYRPTFGYANGSGAGYVDFNMEL